VSVAREEIATDMREGLLAAVGTGLQVMAAVDAKPTWPQCAARKGKHDPGREAVRHGSQANSVT
jgi:putative transposase